MGLPSGHTHTRSVDIYPSPKKDLFCSCLFFNSRRYSYNSLAKGTVRLEPFVLKQKGYTLIYVKIQYVILA